MLRPRDSKRKQVYEAEEAAFPQRLHKDEFPTINEARAYARKVWKQSLGYGQPPMVLARRGFGAHATCFTIALSKGSRNRLVILHELAHSCNDRHMRSQKAGHGAEWAGLFLYLVKRHLGPEAFHRLAREMEARGVDYNLPTQKAADR